MKLLVPPLKCQGIKTKLVPMIKESIPSRITGSWIEPFCGSGVVALNIQPDKALLADTNVHIINLYRQIQSKVITPALTREFLEQEGAFLRQKGEQHYYDVRTRFNQSLHPLDFLFLNRACFNGVMRFNSHGRFNVPFCRKPERFSPAYITKIVNQVKAFAEVVSNKDWVFAVADFRATLAKATPNDFIYADPPYIGRHVDYYNSWNEQDEQSLVSLLQNQAAHFLLSTWHSNKYRANITLDSHWQNIAFFLKTHEHFYHVGATEDLRNAMTEALISNYSFG